MPNPAIGGADPHFTYTESEWLLTILKASGHARAEYLAQKVTDAGTNPAAYERLAERVRRNQ